METLKKNSAKYVSILSLSLSLSLSLTLTEDLPYQTITVQPELNLIADKYSMLSGHSQAAHTIVPTVQPVATTAYSPVWVLKLYSVRVVFLISCHNSLLVCLGLKTVSCACW